MASAYEEGNRLFIQQRFEEAAACYDAAVDRIQDSTSAASKCDLYIARAACNERMGLLNNVVADARLAIAADPSSISGWYHLGSALLGKKEEEEAYHCLTKAKALVAALPRATFLAAAINSKLRECPVPKHVPSASTDSSKVVADTKLAAAEPAAATRKARFEWYQSLDSLTITYFAKGVDETKSSIVVAPQGITVSFSLDTGSDFVQELNLHDLVDTASMVATYRPTKVEVKLSKDPKTRYMWPTLERSSAAPKLVGPTVAPTVVAPTAKPPSAYASKKNWAAIEKEIDNELADEKPEGEAALQKLFQQIYSSGDEETRRAMNRSFQLSGGTVLSTNWGDVAKRDFEAEKLAPPGQEVKKFEH